MFTYKFGLLGWSGDATIGYNTDGRFYWNHYLSGTDQANDVASFNSSHDSWHNIIKALCMFLWLCIIFRKFVSFLPWSFIDVDHLPFLALGNTTDVDRNDVPSGLDEVSAAIAIDTGLPLGADVETLAYVCNSSTYSRLDLCGT